jgi:hypothetical protein
VYVLCRSCRVRGWANALLRFELKEYDQSVLMPMKPTAASGPMAFAVTPMLASGVSAPAELQHAGVAPWNKFSRLRQHWLLLRLHCRMFLIPVAMRCAGGGGEVVFDWRWMRPLQWLADPAHVRFNVGFMFFLLTAPSIACVMFLQSQSQVVSHS